MGLHKFISWAIAIIAFPLGAVLNFFKMSYSDQVIDFNFEVDIIRRAMKLYGLWPLWKHQDYIFGFSVFLHGTSSLLSTNIFTEWDPRNVFQYAMSFFSIFFTIKIIIFKWNRKDYEKLIAEMDYNWRRLQYMSNEKQTIAFEYMKRTRNIVKCWIIGFVVTCLAILMLILARGLFQERPQLLYHFWYPAPTLESPHYELLFVFQLLLTTYMATGCMTLEGCFVVMNLHCCAQLKIVADTIEQIHDDIDCSENRYDGSCIECIVQRHLEIIEFNKLCKKFFGRLLVPNLIIVFVIGFTCSASFVWLDSDEVILRAVCVLLALVVAMAGFLACAIGEFLNVESTNISDAVYRSTWYNFSRTLKKDLFIIMTYAESRPMKLPFGLLFTLSMEFAKDCVFRVYSIFSLFRSVKES